LPTAKVFYAGTEVPIAEFLADLRDRQAALSQLSRWPSLSDREVIKRLLPLANEAKPEEKAEAFALLAFGIYLANPGLHVARDIADYWKLPERASQVLAWWQAIEEDRVWFREKLKAVLEGPTQARAQVENAAELLRDDMVLVPHRDWYVREPSARANFYPLSIGAACSHALLLLLDRRRMRKLGGHLASCRLGCCQSYFLSVAPVGGGPRPKYCTPEHQRLATKLTGAERTRRWRTKRVAKHK
jgi:hypothetical protein